MNVISKAGRFIHAYVPAKVPVATQAQNAIGQRLVQRFYGVSLGLALPMAVFTCNGLLGLLVHAIALSGAASLLEQSARGCARTCPAVRKERPDAQW